MALSFTVEAIHCRRQADPPAVPLFDVVDHIVELSALSESAQLHGQVCCNDWWRLTWLAR